MSRRFLLFLIATLTCVFVLAGCGSNGKDGTNGTNGVTTTNTVTTTVSTTVDATGKTVTQTEACAVCHDDVASIHATSGNDLAVSGATAAVAGYTASDSVTLTFTVKNSDGTPYTAGFGTTTSGTTQPFTASASLYAAYLDPTNGWTDYFTKVGSVNGTTKTYNAGNFTLVGAKSDKTLINVASTYVSNASGTYTVTFPLVADAATDTATYPASFLNGSVISPNQSQWNRLVFYAKVYPKDTNGDGVIDSNDAPSFVQATADIVPDGSTPTTKPDLSSRAACIKCHDSQGYIAHRGRSDEKFCVVCHNKLGAGVYNQAYSMENFIHGIHASEHNGGFYWKSGKSFDVKYPQSLANCTTCHSTSTNSSAATDVTAQDEFKGSTCITCHGGYADASGNANTFSWDNFEFPTISGVDYKAFHKGFSGTPGTQDCTTSCHNGSVAKTLAQIHKGTQSDILNGGNIKYKIDTITYDSTKSTNNLTVKWYAYNDTNSNDTVDSGEALNVKNLTENTTDPVFMTSYKYRTNSDNVAISDGLRFIIGYYGYGSNDISANDTSTYTSLASTAAGAAERDNGLTSPVYTNTAVDSTTKEATTTLTVKPATVSANKSVKLAIGIIGIPTLLDTYGTRVNAVVKSVTSDVDLSLATAQSPSTTNPQLVSMTNCDSCHYDLTHHNYEENAYTAATSTTSATWNAYGRTTIDNVNACRICHVKSAAAFYYAQQSRGIASYVHGIHAEEMNTSGESVGYPNNIGNCTRCHQTNTTSTKYYEVPDQSLSLPGMVSAFYGTLNTTTNTYPISVGLAATTGPAATSCGGCHRADLSTGAAEFNAHTGTMGYRVDSTKVTFDGVMQQIYALLGKVY